MSYDNLAFAVLNKYVANHLDEIGLVPKLIPYDGTDYPSMIPVQQIKEVNDSGPYSGGRQRPFIVYDVEYRVDRYDVKEYWQNSEAIFYYVYSSDYTLGARIITALKDLFKHHDWSANRINELKEDTDYTFFYTIVREVGMPMPTSQEGGRHAAMIYIEYDYVENNIESDPASINRGMRL